MIPEIPLELSFLHTVSPVEKRSKTIAGIKQKIAAYDAEELS